MRYTYRDFNTAKTHYTKGKFIGWSKKTGPLNVRYAGFDRGATMLWIPFYLLTKETKAAIVQDEIVNLVCAGDELL